MWIYYSGKAVEVCAEAYPSVRRTSNTEDLRSQSEKAAFLYLTCLNLPPSTFQTT
jgi:hypothetical protein